MANILTRKGFNNLLNAGYLGDLSLPTKINVGIGTTSPTNADAELTKRIPISGTETVDDCETTDWVDGTDTNSTLNSALFKIGSNSLSIAKSGTTGTTMSISKATTSRDLTDKDFWVWVYVLDKTDLVTTGTALTIRFGSDSSNYYYYDVDIDDVSDGWNAITFDSSSASTTGTPTITVCDYSEVIFNVDDASDTIVADRILIDDLKVADADSYDRVFDAGYPIVDENSSEVEMQTRLGTTDAIGYPITEAGHLDDSDNLLSRSVASADNKTTSDIFIEVERLKLINR